MSVREQKYLACVLCMVVCISIISAPRAAAVNDPTDNGYNAVVPLMDYIYDADYDFVVSDGRARMYAVVRGHSSKATKCEVTVELQEKGIIFWDTIRSWTQTENGRRAELDVSYNVTTGKSYRMVTTVTVWNGSDSESRSMTSEVLKA